jgi:hypothetical protein
MSNDTSTTADTGTHTDKADPTAKIDEQYIHGDSFSRLRALRPNCSDVVGELAERLAPEVAAIDLRHGAKPGEPSWAAKTFDLAEQLYAEGVRRGIYDADQPAAE